MTRTDDALARILHARVVAIVRAPTAGEAERVARRLLHSGVDVLEIALTTPSGLDVMAGLRETFPEALVGAGTVLDPATARSALAAGAQFLVSPDGRPEVIAAARDAGAVSVPGALTPTEITDAVRAGADLVKLFPASVLRIGGFRDLRAALPQVKLVPTGGIRIADALDWWAVGAAAIGLGSSLAVASDTEVQALLAAAHQ